MCEIYLYTAQLYTLHGITEWAIKPYTRIDDNNCRQAFVISKPPRIRYISPGQPCVIPYRYLYYPTPNRAIALFDHPPLQMTMVYGGGWKCALPPKPRSSRGNECSQLSELILPSGLKKYVSSFYSLSTAGAVSKNCEAHGISRSHRGVLG